VGGCLWLLAQGMGTPWELRVDGDILFIEEFDAPPWYVDGMLTQLGNAGKLAGAAGVVVGEMDRCDWRETRPEWPRTKSLEDVLEEHLGQLGVPVVYKLPIGHGKHLATVPLGVRATLDADARTLTIDQEALAPASGPREGMTRVGRQRRWRPLAALAALALLAAACGGGGGGGTGGGQGGKVVEGGTFRLGTGTGIDSLNPYVAFQQDAYSTFEYIYPFLVQYDEKLAFAPDFAESWTTSSDGKVWTFKTRAGAKWSDGQPLTAKDAAWTFSTTLKFADGSTANQAPLLSHVAKAEATDDTTLVITYEEPVANVLSQLQQAPILPRHVWEQYASGKGEKLKTFANPAPVVSGGPFVLTQHKKNEITLFKKNPNFYGPKPHVDAVGLKFYANDDAMVTALKAGEIDGVAVLPPTNVDTAKQAGLVVLETPGLEFREVIINSNPKKTRNRELLDPKVKQAIEHAIDRQRIIQVAWLGHATPGTTIVPPSTGQWHDRDLQPVGYDLAAANRLLDEAGFAKGADGMRVANGHPMAYTLIFPQDERGKQQRSFEIIQGDLAKVGIKVTQKVLDNDAAFSAITAPDNKYLDFDLAMWDWVPLADPDFILSVLTCGQFGGWSDSGYCDPAYDKMYHEQGLLTDPAKRRQKIYEMQRKVYDDRPYIVLSYDNQIEAHSKKWDGLVLNPQGSFNSMSKQSWTQVHRVAS
jgi:peptide/nickel transport system substrate-binding protein